ncbi:MAG: CrcB family protein [Bryobacteraceae bacterium]
MARRPWWSLRSDVAVSCSKLVRRKSVDDVRGECERLFLHRVTGRSHLGGDLRYRLLLGVGLLGGYTTFSALELEALLSARAGDWIAVAAILAGSMIAGFGAVWLGYALTARS